MKFFPLAIIMALFFCASCSGNGEPLTVGLLPDFDSVPVILANQLGYFDNVELQLFKGPLDRDSALFSGALDGTVSDYLQVCMANDKDFPVRITSGTVSMYGVVAGGGSGISSLAQLEGRTVGLSLSTVIEYVLDSALAKEGLDPAAAEKTSVPAIPSRLELLSQGQIDAIAVPEPYITASSQTGGTVLATSGELGVKPGVIMFTQPAIEGKSDQIKKFYEALEKAADYMATHDPNEFFPAVIEEMGLPDAASLVPMPVYGGEGLPDEADLMQAMDWLLSRDMITKTFSYEQLVYNYAGN
jgi:NitT/TauT family transport system substrate-binding protein